MAWNLNLCSGFALFLGGIYYICVAEGLLNGPIGSFEDPGVKKLSEVGSDDDRIDTNGEMRGLEERIQGFNEELEGFSEGFWKSGEFNQVIYGSSNEGSSCLGEGGHFDTAHRDFFDNFEDRLGILGQDLVSTPITKNGGRYLPDPLTRLFPQIFVSAQETSSSTQPEASESSQSSFHSIFLFLFSVVELVLSSSHILVHLGLKNPRYRFIIKQRVYFVLDGATTTTNLVYFWDSYYYLKPFLLYAICAHIYYVADLFLFSGKSSIFEWSSVDKGKNRFQSTYIRENIETSVDDLCHLFGFITAFSLLSSTIQLVSIVLSFTLLYILVLKAKFFFSKRHMMPSWLHVLAEDSQ